MSIADKILNLKIPGMNVLTKSKMLQNQQEYVDLGIPALNVAFSGKMKGGLTSGISIFFGESRNGKTLLAMLCAGAYLNHYPESTFVFLDSEGGTNTSYFDLFNMDKNRIIHLPVGNVEETKFNLVKILEELNENDRVIFVLDSLGNLASKKEVDDAISEKNSADLSRARAIKSLFRIITPYFNRLNIPFIGINHSYKTMDFIPQDVMSGGSGPLLSANNIFLMTKSKERGADKELEGFKFKMKAFKSRTIRETSTFCLNIDFQKGIDIYSDLFDAALELGFITSPSKGFYSKKGDEKTYRQKAFEFVEPIEGNIWESILNDPEFISAYEHRYSLAGSQSDNPKQIIQEKEENTNEELTDENESDSLISKQKKARGKK